MHLRRSWLWAGLVMAVSAALFAAEQSAATTSAPAAAAGDEAAANPLVWDAMNKTVEANRGDGAAEFHFSVTNTGSETVKIEQIRPSCGCTVAEMPSTPWILAAGAKGTFTARIDLRGKQGVLSKSLFVNSTAGTQVLGIHVKIPVMDDAERKRNQAIAQANRQAVFQGECASCHVKPAEGKMGGELFTVACGVCHFASNRATMVADLLTAKEHRDAEFWRKWISEGKEGTLMPAWSKEHGGPLTKEQIESLVQFATAALPSDPPPKP
jgi:mono/diheme cytochrome c family protein